VEGYGHVQDGAKRLSIILACVSGSVVRNGFSLYPFTLNSSLRFGSKMTTAPCGKTVRTMKGLDQRVFSFPAKM